MSKKSQKNQAQKNQERAELELRSNEGAKTTWELGLFGGDDLQLDTFDDSLWQSDTQGAQVINCIAPSGKPVVVMIPGKSRHAWRGYC